MKTYTEEQIKKAFWETFHESGELWFDYLGPEDTNNDSTICEWDNFKEELEKL